MSDWYDDDDFWRCIERFLFTQKRNNDMAIGEVERIVDLAGLPAAASVLDLPCGTGRHALLFAAHGYRVTAVDRTKRYLDAVREQAESRQIELELVASDMRSFSRPGSYDLALNLFSSLGYFDDPDDDVRVLANFHESLRAGGKLIVDTMSKEILSRDWQPRRWTHDEESDEYLLEESHLLDGWSRVESHWDLGSRGAERKRFSFRMNLYSGSGIVRALRQAGFSKIELFGNLDGDPYDNNAERLIALAERD